MKILAKKRLIYLCVLFASVFLCGQVYAISLDFNFSSVIDLEKPSI